MENKGTILWGVMLTPEFRDVVLERAKKDGIMPEEALLQAAMRGFEHDRLCRKESK